MSERRDQDERDRILGAAVRSMFCDETGAIMDYGSGRDEDHEIVKDILRVLREEASDA